MSIPKDTTAPALTQVFCPVCEAPVTTAPLERCYGSALYGCKVCDLCFWNPVEEPDPFWYEVTYQGRDQTEMPLEPGHRCFFGDAKAPKRGRLLDLGCGVGNFLSAARVAGFDVAGVEFNRSAVRFAQEHYRLQNVFVARPEEFLAQHPRERFDVVTFFEVLEHQENPQKFIEIAKQLLAPDGFVALSVPNRYRWQKTSDPLDYPPNHLTRWSPTALRNFLERSGFEVLSLYEQPLSMHRAAEVLSTGWRTGLLSHVAGEQTLTLRDLSHMTKEQVNSAIQRLEGQPRHQLAAALARWKTAAMLPVAALCLPFLRARGCKGLYLYSLARLKRCGAGDGCGRDRFQYEDP